MKTSTFFILLFLLLVRVKIVGAKRVMEINALINVFDDDMSWFTSRPKTPEELKKDESSLTLHLYYTIPPAK